MTYGPSDLMGDLIVLVEKRWATVHDVKVLIEPLEIAEVTRRIHCFREIKRIIRLMPLRIFTDDEQRQNLLTVCQLALDEAIDEEEDQWLEQ